MRDRLIELLKQIDFDYGEECVCASEDGYKGAPDLAEFFADRLLANGVIVPPCKVGSTIYRIDYREQRCSRENESYDEYYCRECPHLELGYCDYRRELPYIYVIKDANAQAILGNQHLFGTRAFLTREEAEKALAEVANGT